MERAVETGLVFAAYHSFWLLERDGPTPMPLVKPENGLIAAQPGAVQIWTGVHTGNVSVSVDVRDQPPADVDVVSWADVVEIDLESVRGSVQVSSLFANLERELPTLTPHGPGLYRVRLHARGRDRGEFADADAPEEYLVVTWPTASTAPEVVHKQSGS